MIKKIPWYFLNEGIFVKVFVTLLLLVISLLRIMLKTRKKKHTQNMDGTFWRLPEAFCRTLLRAFSTPGAPDVVAERILIGS